MKDAVPKAVKVPKAESVAFEDFDLVVGAFGKAIRVGVIQRVKNGFFPVFEGGQGGVEFREIDFFAGKR